MSVTVTAEFDSVDFAERAARRVKARYPQVGKAVIKCNHVSDGDEQHRVAVPVLNSFHDNFMAIAFTPTPPFSAENTSLFRNETDQRRTAALEITAETAQAEKIAGFLISCGGYRVQKV